ncbi:MAG: hypothetical protein A2729_04210 [Candidatus Buchananbacteria bacterium RIFCSPHIGHO2_01_FULL_39_14]|uniref:Fe2OG dioxygenase domain-containing protein n=1 Tax=Candidatus Buchananbacteria bacterium RIFCSPHIGHO2_01_FULL_39_14 TaxID=1797532 RepID=A0A1G1XXF8_9BACT|nr:MAG: hypothetical protein A2729_04210 [Candidatus Buchananbacteria bacterium RIFCSPHIGHO2_01_FULL_39_14]
MVNLNYSQIKSQMMAQRYASVHFPLSSVELAMAVDDFLAFTDISDTLKHQFTSIKINPDDRGSDVGYMKRQQIKGALDEKEIFHYNEYFPHLFANNPALENPIVDSFLSSAQKVYLSAKACMEEIICEFEPHFPGVYTSFFPQGQLPHLYLRFLKYSTQREDTFLAKGHYDRGACTLALAESGPGLRIGSTPLDLREVEHQDQTAFFFAGTQFAEIITQEFAAAWHDVVQKSEYKLNHMTARWAMVFFADQYNGRITTFEENHRPRE